MFNKYSLSLLWLWASTASAAAAAAVQKDVLLHNEAGVLIDVYWVHPVNGEIHKMTDDNEVKDGMHVPLKSFEGHEFEVHEAGDCGTSGDQVCRRTVFQVTDRPEQSEL